MQRHTWIPAILMLIPMSAVAQLPNSCSYKPGRRVITIDLQNGARSFEPACQPLRIRVKEDRPAAVLLRNLSPTETCSISAKSLLK